MGLVNMLLFTKFLFVLLLMPAFESKEKVQYLGIERPVVVHTNPNYFSNVTVNSRRLGRGNPVHYFSMSGEVRFYVNKNIQVHLMFYEYLTNVYKQSFVELHFDGCSLFENPYFGAFIRKVVPSICPVPPGFYGISNITIHPSTIPKNFPFQRFRIYLNVTLTKTNESVALGYADMELRTIDRNRKELFDT